MPGPYNPPNPYGSYFNFGDFQSAAVESFMPFASGGMSPGTQSMFGRPVGGFNPSPSEYLLNRINNANTARYMAQIYRDDPRTAAFTDMALQAMYGADSKRRQATVERMGGLGNIHEVMGFLMSQPGISGYMGGGPGAIGMGAYAAAASGMGVNGRIMAGDGPLVQAMASAVSQQVNQRFYTPSGAQLTGMTSGLNRNQLSGMMSIMASQGAFREMDIGNLTQGANGPKFTTNPGEISKFVDTIKNGAKALGAIMDVYGDASVSELFSKAQQITGLNFANPQNAQVMAQRLTSLRRTGEMFGIDAQTMFDASKMGMAMAQSMGLSGHMAAYAGTFSANRAAQMSIAVANGRSTLTGGFIPTLQEIQAGSARDVAGMALDPIGVRRALGRLLIDNGAVRDDKAKAEINQMMDTAGVGGANEHQIDAMFRSQGFDLPTIMRGYGGPAGVMRNLTATQAEDITRQNADDMERRAGFRVRQRLLNPAFGQAAGAAFTLMSTFEPATLNQMLGANATELGNKLQQSVEARRNPSKYSQAISEVLAASGGSASVAQAKFAIADQQARTDPLTTAFTSNQAKNNSLRLAAANSPSFTADDQRGFTKQGFLDGILNRYGSTDARSVFARIMASSPGVIAGGVGGATTGLNLNLEDTFDPKRMTSLVNQFQKQFSGSQAGVDMLTEMGLRDRATGKPTSPDRVDLREFHNILTDPTRRQLLFRNFQEFRFEQMSSFVPLTAMERSKQFGGLLDVAKVMVNKGAVEGSQRDYLMAAGAAVGDPNLTLFQVRNGVFGNALRNLTPEQAQEQASNIIKQTITLDVLQKVGASAVQDLGRQNQQWGVAAMESLSSREAELMFSGGDVKSLATIRELKEKLKAGGIADRGAPGYSKLVGTLRLVGPKELEFVQSMLQHGQK